MSINKDRLINNLLEMIKIDSVSLNEKAIGDWIENYFKARGVEVFRDNCGENFNGNCGNILVHIKGNMEGEAICFACHMDTVEPGENIEPVINGNYMTSKGETILAADDKSGIASVLEVIECVKENNILVMDLTVQ
ncbi:M28 family peptidase [Hathewaya histolytica]|uniref:Peptidase T n=1 Tax=Hathewaya histolytica TaxID=1498 RepID=A0A4U9QU53_HATHI|nr:M28 family peptidase [Hathewaya histolytica]VTQ82085.1 peptidase T [Hathewaya histolytica]